MAQVPIAAHAPASVSTLAQTASAASWTVCPPETETQRTTSFRVSGSASGQRTLRRGPTAS
eukprot:7277787-Alexandrium_andersonii.AAC.1